VLDPRLVRVGATEVDVDFHHEVRGELQTRQVRQRGDLQAKFDRERSGPLRRDLRTESTLLSTRKKSQPSST
jgi:hypothetical protein